MPRCPSEPLKSTARPRWARLLAIVAAALMVAPTSAASPIAAPKRAVRSAEAQEQRPNITFTGFRRLADGRALLYVELTSKVPLSVMQQPSGVVYRLEGARVALKNNKNPLLTGAFATNLLSARLVTPRAPRHAKRRGKETNPGSYVDLVLDLRSGVTPTHVMSERAGGAVLEITIPAPRSG